jgi:uncharacterized protein (TIGR00251 family)
VPWHIAADGLRLAVRLTPKAGRDGIDGLKPTAQNQINGGGVELAVKVTAVPENGKANDALLRLLAKRLKLPVSALRLVAGATDRHKQILIDGEPQAMDLHLRAWLAGLTMKE